MTSGRRLRRFGRPLHEVCIVEEPEEPKEPEEPEEPEERDELLDSGHPPDQGLRPAWWIRSGNVAMALWDACKW